MPPFLKKTTSVLNASHMNIKSIFGRKDLLRISVSKERGKSKQIKSVSIRSLEMMILSAVYARSLKLLVFFLRTKWGQ
jgi:hypothetical protein